MALNNGAPLHITQLYLHTKQPEPGQSGSLGLAAVFFHCPHQFKSPTVMCQRSCHQYLSVVSRGVSIKARIYGWRARCCVASIYVISCWRHVAWRTTDATCLQHHTINLQCPASHTVAAGTVRCPMSCRDWRYGVSHMGLMNGIRVGYTVAKCPFTSYYPL